MKWNANIPITWLGLNITTNNKPYGTIRWFPYFYHAIINVVNCWKLIDIEMNALCSAVNHSDTTQPNMSALIAFYLSKWEKLHYDKAMSLSMIMFSCFYKPSVFIRLPIYQYSDLELMRTMLLWITHGPCFVNTFNIGSMARMSDLIISVMQLINDLIICQLILVKVSEYVCWSQKWNKMEGLLSWW